MAEITSLLVALITGVVGWYIKRDTGKTSATNERLEGKLDAIIASQALEARSRARLEIRIERIERFLRLAPFTPPEGTGSVGGADSSTRVAIRDTLPGPY